MYIKKEIERLINYGRQNNLLGKWDEIPVRNSLMELFEVESPFEGIIEKENLEQPTEILNNLIDYGYEIGLIEKNSDTFRDLLDAKIMGLIIPRQSEIVSRFWNMVWNESVVKATDEFYEFCKNSNYIRIDRISKNKIWETKTEFGDLEITINLSKPEKDPKAIAAAKLNKEKKYPKCLLCKENPGYPGRLDHFGRQNHRIIPVRLTGDQWYFQYSPYSYYNEHCIVFSENHTPMSITRKTFDRMFDFIDQFPHYFVGSNADLPIVGGSILSHDHFQGGNHTFAMARAKIRKELFSNEYPDINIGIVKWPLSVVRLQSKDYNMLVDLSEYIHNKWKKYSDKKLDVINETNGTLHNTITPIARRRGELFEIDLVLRNNRTDENYPDGIFHPHKEYHNIKKENIGLIEVMGLAVLPGRLKKELQDIAELFSGEAAYNEDEIKNSEALSKHLNWIKQLKKKYPQNMSIKEALNMIKNEVGYVFSKVLENAGVYKQDEKGQEGFIKFLKEIGFKEVIK